MGFLAPSLSLSQMQIEAVFFDMDGTLTDTEPLAEMAIACFLRERCLSGAGFDLAKCHGLTWESISLLLKELFPVLLDEPVKEKLLGHLEDILAKEPLVFIPGAERALSSSAAFLPTAIVTSAHREAVQHFFRQTSCEGELSFYLCDEDFARSKPSPECYLLAAKRLGLPPQKCLVFEDSYAGITAARKAGAVVCGILGGRRQMPLECDYVINDYRDLPGLFFS